MIDRTKLLSDLQKLLTKLEADLLERSESSDVPDVGATLRAEFERAKKAERTAQNYEDWRSDAITQHAAAWVLACVFVRFLEDNRLIDPPKIAGPGERLQRARDEHELYFREHPTLTDRDYLLSVFDALAKLPGTKDLFGEHNPIRELPNWLSGDAAGELLKFFQKIEANSGLLVHDFTDANWDTRFLGDLYQDLSEAARKKYALLQTPEFVEEFILERTLEPALEEFGLEPLALATVSGSSGEKTEASANGSFKMIDPACGSGHFLLGSFRRILDRWQRREPGTNVRELVQRTLDSVHGVDVNPFAIAIARFRLLLAAMRACGIARLADAPAFRLNLVCGDSLLHAPLAAGGKKYTAGQQELDFALASDPADSDECDHAYRSENLPELKRLLRGGQYHAVVANPPYITPKDRQLNERYRRRYRTCHMKYSLSVPFLERIFRLTVAGGYTGQITANSFMKREFGKKLIESFFPSVDLTHVIDTQLAHIPGHGTPTVILFGRHRPPIASQIRLVGAIKREDDEPTDPANGLVWSAILAQVDQPGSQSEYVSVGDVARELFHKHPWSIGGGGAAELKEQLEEAAALKLETLVDCIGFSAILGEDEAFGSPVGTNRMRRLPGELRRPIIEGDKVRDWNLDWESEVLFPYTTEITLRDDQLIKDWFWPLRCVMSARADFSKRTYAECGRPYWEYHQIPVDRNRTPLSLVFCEVTTHNHFVLDRGGKVFKQTAPVIKLPRESTEGDHLALLGLLNSSVGGFWIKQVCHCKGGGGIGGGIASESWERFYAFNGTKLQQFPLPVDRPLLTARLLDILATRTRDFQPASIASREVPTRAAFATAKSAAQLARSQMIAAQEELDWECYRLYGLIEDEGISTQRHREHGENTKQISVSSVPLCFPPLQLGQRAFEIVLARKMAAGETQTTWFERHGSTPITELPAEWPDDYRQLVQRRIDLIASDPHIRLIEQPEYKRRWNTEPWDAQLARALREWLLDRLESYFDFDGRMRESGQQSAVSGQPEEKKADSRSLIAESSLVSVAKLADVARQDAEFQQVGELYRDDPAFDVQKLVEELVAAECVPLLPVLRYKPTGLRKRAEWEKTWELQREEDRLAAQRVAADERILKAAAAVSETFGVQKRELESLEQKFREACLSVRGKFAPKVVFSAAESPSVMARLLGSRGVSAEGGAAFSAMTSMMEDFESKSASFDVLVGAALKDDPEYRAAVAAREAIPPNPKIDVPPKYDSKDFLDSNLWRLRGKLDVPKERWISFPHCDGPDGTLVIAWAGYDHLQQAKAISAYYVDIQERLGGRDDPRLPPLLAGMLELLPWLKQWHNDPDATFDGLRMGDYFEGFVNDEAKQLGKTVPEIKAWEPPQRTRNRGRR